MAQLFTGADVAKQTRGSGSRIVLFLATGAGIGYLPYCPGTLGTIVAIPLALGINHIAAFDLRLAAVLIVVLAAVAIWLADRGSLLLDMKDPPAIVIDEIVGFAVASFLTAGWLDLIIAFGLFRFFDITKVFPAGRLQELPGGAGIVLDDLMAGLYTFCLLRLFSWTGML